MKLKKVINNTNSYELEKIRTKLCKEAIQCHIDEDSDKEQSLIEMIKIIDNAIVNNKKKCMCNEGTLLNCKGDSL